jgi:hypothetical protein
MMMRTAKGEGGERNNNSRRTPYLEKAIHRISLHCQLVKALDETSDISADGWIHLMCHFCKNAPFNRGFFVFPLVFLPGAPYLRRVKILSFWGVFP